MWRTIIDRLASHNICSDIDKMFLDYRRILKNNCEEDKQFRCRLLWVTSLTFNLTFFLNPKELIWSTLFDN